MFWIIRNLFKKFFRYICTFVYITTGMEEKIPVISLEQADIVNGESTVIYGMDMNIYPGDFVYIVGKVGTGKTSIIRTVIAENPLTTGWKDSTAISKRISEVLDAVGMSYKAHKMPHQLSGGEQQRIAIARSLLNSPEVIIADEPTGNLDPETADGIMQLLKRINTEEGTAIVMVTHNMNLCDRYQGRMMVCKDEKCQEKECEEIIDLSITDL